MTLGFGLIRSKKKEKKYGEQIFEGVITMTIKMTRDNNKYKDVISKIIYI